MELHSISLSRAGRLVFQGLSLQLTERRLGLIGANGSGKSSLLRLLKGLTPPTAGRVTRTGPVGLVFQNPEHQLLFPTVAEELCFGAIEQGADPSQAKERAANLLHQHHLSFLLDRAVHELSDGQKQLICIFSVILDGAGTILLDEPCASLDLATTRRVMALVNSLPQQIVLATHDLRLLADYDRVLWLEDGRIRQDGRPSQVLSAYESAQNGHDSTRRE